MSQINHYLFYHLSTFGFHRLLPIAIGLLSLLSASGQPQPALKISQLSTKDGLSDNRIESIFQDSKGFMWFGTDGNGLNRFDGRRIKTWVFDPDHPELDYPAWVGQIVEGQNGKIWIAGSALFLYHPEEDRFESFPQDQYGNNRGVSGIYVDRQGKLWLGSNHTGDLLLFDPLTREFLSLAKVFDRKLEVDYKARIIEDSYGDLWCSHPNGLYQFVWSDSSLVDHALRENLRREVNDQFVLGLYEDSRRDIWVGTKTDLLKFNRKTNQFARIPLNHQYNNFQGIHEGPDGKLWFAANEAGGQPGMYELDRQTFGVMRYPLKLNNGDDPVILPKAPFYHDQQGGRWIGTFNSGILYWNIHQKPFTIYPRLQAKEKNENFLLLDRKTSSIWKASKNQIQPYSFNEIASLNRDFAAKFWVTEDQEGQIWAGSWSNGLMRYDPAGQSGVNYQADPNRSGSLPGNAALTVHTDRQGTVWVSVLGEGLLRYDPQKDVFIPHPLVHPHNGDTLRKFVARMYEDRIGNLWISTALPPQGIFKIKPDRTIEEVFEIPFFKSMYEDENGLLWLGTGEGLYRLNPANKQYRFWRTKDGLPHNSIFSLLPDDHGNLWLGTRKGLARFNPQTETFKVFTTSDGLPDNNFGDRAAMKTTTGEFLFETGGQLFSFHPDSIRDNPHKPTIVITDFQIRNGSEPMNGSKAIPYTREIHLEWDQHDFTLEFSALNYFQPEKNQYEYRLDPHDKTWISTDATRPYATYTNLDPGKYTFRVRGSNNDGLFNTESTTLAITIFPPWWLTAWAKILYLLSAIALLFLIRHLELRRQKRKLEAQQRINAVTSKFVPNAFLSALGRNDLMEVKLGDAVAQEVTVMFSDIRDYTSLSENMTPQETFQFVTEFNRRMGPVIQKNDGFVNQYLGDAIMALFKNSPRDCLSAAVQMQQTLTEYNQQRISKGLPPLRLGIGLHTGPLIMGIIGDEQRMDAATISDTVNTASRIESLTKHFKVNILLSEQSLQQIQHRSVDALPTSAGFHFRFLGEVQLKGKKEPQGIYECFSGDQPDIVKKKIETYSLFDEGLKLYFSRQFADAGAAFNKVLEIHPDDLTARFFLEKSFKYQSTGVAKDWTGVEVMTFK